MWPVENIMQSMRPSLLCWLPTPDAVLSLNACKSSFTFCEFIDSTSGVARNFHRAEGGHNFHIFFKSLFFGRTNLKLIEKQKKL